MTAAYTDPGRTIRLLDELVTKGFTNEAFSELHHLAGVQTTKSHRDYCEKGGIFQVDGTNSAVQKRLEMVLKSYWGGGYRSASPEIWLLLARAAVIEIPFE